ncbi:MAG: hypothetical protein ACI9HK_004048 [Pirellulaceae bacterium]|jgi:hypothetical protein
MAKLAIYKQRGARFARVLAVANWKVKIPASNFDDWRDQCARGFFATIDQKHSDKLLALVTVDSTFRIRGSRPKSRAGRFPFVITLTLKVSQ